MSLVGHLIIAMVCTRPGIAYLVGVLNRFMVMWQLSENMNADNLNTIRTIIIILLKSVTG